MTLQWRKIVCFLRGHQRYDLQHWQGAKIGEWCPRCFHIHWRE